MKILVPCDFSKISNNAALYAAKFAKKVNAEIILFNVTHFAHPPNVQVGFKEHEIEELRFSDAARDCTLLVEKLKSTVKGIQISFKVVTGFPMESLIEDYAIHNKVDLIVMGTKGASGLQKALFGSNAVNVINRNSIPVITVPGYARFNNLKHIVFASDTSDMLKIQPRIQKLVLLAQLFDASIYIFHVLPQDPQDSDEKIDVMKIKDTLINKYKYKKISFHVSHNDDVVEAINDFVADKKTDLLAMFTHDITFFENVFNTSVSREMAFHSLVPLLTIKK
jgi:nucleotide-binding universal stress UspA family protein